MISRGDKVRIALAPAHIAVGGVLTWQWTRVRTPMLLVLGLLFVAFGIYRIVLVRRGLRQKR